MKFNNQPPDHFDNRPAKEFLEDLIYTYIGRIMRSHVLVITGPSIERHIINSFKIASDNRFWVHCIDMDEDTFSEMTQRLEKMSIDTSRVELGLGDVTNYEWVFKLPRPCRFEDLDLCQSLGQTKGIIMQRLIRQSSNHGGTYDSCVKCLMFTTSSRPKGIEDFFYNLNTILNEIGAEIRVNSTVRQGPNGVYKHNKRNIHEWSPVLSKHGRLLNRDPLTVYTYRDGAPMVSCVIMYR